MVTREGQVKFSHFRQTRLPFLKKQTMPKRTKKKTEDTHESMQVDSNAKDNSALDEETTLSDTDPLSEEDQLGKDDPDFEL